jgi:hypothetical protein
MIAGTRYASEQAAGPGAQVPAIGQRSNAVMERQVINQREGRGWCHGVIHSFGSDQEKPSVVKVSNKSVPLVLVEMAEEYLCLLLERDGEISSLARLDRDGEVSWPL